MDVDQWNDILLLRARSGEANELPSTHLENLNEEKPNDPILEDTSQHHSQRKIQHQDNEHLHWRPR
jgi:hypothetical protein